MKTKILLLVLCFCGFAAQSFAQEPLISGTDTLACWSNDSISGCQGELVLTVDSTGVVRDANGDTIFTLNGNNTISDSNGDLIGSVSDQGEVRDLNYDLIGNLSAGEVRDLNNDLIGHYHSTPVKLAGLYFFFLSATGAM